MHSPKTLGFTLVELSIVLVILGLLTGGILTGQSLIRAAELRSVTVEFQRYQAAIQSFRDKYQNYPGDMKNATRFWGDNNTLCADAAIADGVPGTCNGDGDGIIDDGTEWYLFWQHLANAGLIEGSYTAVAGGGGAPHHIPGTNSPMGKLSNSGWWAAYLSSSWGGNSDLYAMGFGNYLGFGGATTNARPLNGIIRPEEAWNIDTKLDDGLPGKGKIIANGWNDACSMADDGSPAMDDFNASYKLSSNAIQCAMYFRHLF